MHTIITTITQAAATLRCRYLIPFFILLIGSITARAGIWPAEGASLHYTLIGFSYPSTQGAHHYLLEIAEGHITREDSFQKAIVLEENSEAPRQIATVPHWAAAYTWRVTAMGSSGKAIGNTPFYHFSVQNIPYADTAQYRLRIVENDHTNKDLFLLVDCNRVLYSADGQPLWCLPPLPGVNIDAPVRDMKLTPQHTITFISNTQAYEVDYNGNLLWKAPDDGSVSGDSSEFYHHEFTRLPNGHYMIAGNQYIRKYLPPAFAALYGSNNNVKQENGRYYADVAYGTLIEYNSKKKVIWSWKSAQSFTDADLFAPVMFENDRVPGFHHNAFYFDIKNKVIYNSFRDIDRILKISYPSGRLLATYGRKGNSPGLYTGQHSCRIDSKGNLYLFNNNFSMNVSREAQNVSSVMVLKEEPRDSLTLLSVFDCDIDNETTVNAKGGGNVYELENGNMLVCMGTASRIFILGDNKVRWHAFVENKNENRWLYRAIYRVGVIEGKEQLQQLIFNK